MRGLPHIAEKFKIVIFEARSFDCFQSHCCQPHYRTPKREMSHRSDHACKLWKRKNSTIWRMPEVQSFASDPRVYGIGGPTCRWSMKFRRSNNKEEFSPERLTSSKVECHQKPDDLGWCDKWRGTALCRSQCQVKVNIPQSLKEHGESTASALTRTKLLDEERKEEMNYIRKHCVFEVAYETGVPLKLRTR